jgi:transcriptional regulator with GAF, ATPase, and Fis domain
MEREGELSRKAEEFMGIFKKGIQFTQELLKENERLRYKIIKLEEDKKNLQKQVSAPEVSKLKQTIHQLEQEKTAILDKYREVEEENKDFASRYLEVEEENNNLANLYVASYQLHSTLDFKEVLRIVIEIIINLIGSDRFAILLLDDSSQVLSAVASEGLREGEIKKVKVGEGIIGTVAKSGESHFEQDLEHFTPTSDFHPIVCIPLKIKEHTIGVIAIFTLFEQKRKKLTRVDYELFSMLAGHAATAVFSAKLYSQSERKLSTIQGFIDLLSGKAK